MRQTTFILILGLVGFSAFLLFGCTGCGLIPSGPLGNTGNTNSATHNGVATSPASGGTVPEKCAGMENCQLFACMVPQCWCKEDLDGGVLSPGSSNTKITSTDAAMIVVRSFLNSKSIDYKTSSLRAIKLNDNFYNVFYETPDGIELTLTVGVDGTILETVCGV